MKKKLIGIILIISSILIVGCGEKEEAQAEPTPVPKRESGLVDLTALSGADYAKKIDDILNDPDRYEGVVVKVKGKAKKYHDQGLNEDFYMCLTTWESGTPEGFCYVLGGGRYPKSGSMITITGILSNYAREMDGQTVEYTELRETKILEEEPEVTPAPTNAMPAGEGTIVYNIKPTDTEVKEEATAENDEKPEE